MTVQQLVLVAKPGDAREAYLREIRRLGQEVDVSESLGELHDLMRAKAYHGIFIDLATKVRATPREKELLHDVLSTAPTATLKWVAAQDEVRALFHGQIGETGTVEAFYTQQCRGKFARRIRLDLRVAQNLNVLLRRADAAGADATGPAAEQRTITTDISHGGCFVFTTETWTLGALGQIVFQDLVDRSPVDVEVRWVLPWGKALKVPGLGLIFCNPEQGPVVELRERFRLRTRNGGADADANLLDEVGEVG